MHESNPPSLLLNTTVLSTAGTAIVGATTPRKVTMRAVTERISKFRTDCHCGCIDVQYTLGVPSNYGCTDLHSDKYGSQLHTISFCRVFHNDHRDDPGCEGWCRRQYCYVHT